MNILMRGSSIKLRPKRGATAFNLIKLSLSRESQVVEQSMCQTLLSPFITCKD